MKMSELPLLAFEEIPEAKPNAKEITALVKESGKIIGYELDNKTIVGKEEAISLAKNGDIAGVGIAINKDTKYLKSLPDGTEGNNLSSLPTVSNKI